MKNTNKPTFKALWFKSVLEGACAVTGLIAIAVIFSGIFDGWSEGTLQRLGVFLLVFFGIWHTYHIVSRKPWLTMTAFIGCLIAKIVCSTALLAFVLILSRMVLQSLSYELPALLEASKSVDLTAIESLLGSVVAAVIYLGFDKLSKRF